MLEVVIPLKLIGSYCYYLIALAIGDGEASKIAAIENGKIIPDVLVTGGGIAGDGLMGQLTRLLPGIDLRGLMKKQDVPPEVRS